MSPDFAGLAAWGRVAVTGPMAGGARSRLWRAERGAERLVLRRCSESEASMRWLIGVQRAAERAGLHLAALLPSADGRLVVGGWTVEPFLDDVPAEDRDVLALRPHLLRWQACCRGHRQRPGHLPLREARHLPKPLQRIIRALLPDGPLVAVHGDIHPGNLLRLPSGRLGLVDWEEARADHAGVDLLGTLPISGAGQESLWLAAEVSACWAVEPERARRLARRLRAMPGRLDVPRCRGCLEVIEAWRG